MGIDVAEDVLGGVFATNELVDESWLLVVNTDPASRPGRHWVCICVKKGRLQRVFQLVWEMTHCVFRTLHEHTLLIVDI